MSATGGEGSEDVEVVIAVDDAHLDALAAVVEDLRGAGLEVTGVQEALGTITGHAPAAALAGLTAREGIHLEASRTYRLPPPGIGPQGGEA